MTEFRIEVVVDPRQVERGMDRVDRRIDKTSKKSGNLINVSDIRRNIRYLHHQLDLTEKKLTGIFDTKFLRGLLGFTGFGIIAREAILMGDSFIAAQNKLRVLLDGEEEVTRSTRELFKVARETRSSFTATAALYQRVGLSARSLGKDQYDLLKVVKAVNQAVILSGSTAKEAENGLIQLSQGIASNRLAGDELRSVLEQLTGVSRVLEKELGVTRGELRELGQQGKITGDVILRAFEGQADEIAGEFAKTVPTLGQAFTVLKNSVQDVIGTFTVGTGVFEAASSAVLLLADSLKVLSVAFVTAAPLAAVVAWQRYAISLKFTNTQKLQAAILANSLATAEFKSAEAAILEARAEIASAKALQQKAVYTGGAAVATERLAAAELQLAAATAASNRALEKGAAASATVASLSGKNPGILAALGAKLGAIFKALAAAATGFAGAMAVLVGSFAALRIFRSEAAASETSFGRFVTALNMGIDMVVSSLSFLGDVFGPVVDGAKKAWEVIADPALFDRAVDQIMSVTEAFGNMFRSQESIDERNAAAQEEAQWMVLTRGALKGLTEERLEEIKAVKTKAELDAVLLKYSIDKRAAISQENRATEESNELLAKQLELLGPILAKQQERIQVLKDTIAFGSEAAKIEAEVRKARKAALDEGAALSRAQEDQIRANATQEQALLAIKSALGGYASEQDRLAQSMDFFHQEMLNGTLDMERYLEVMDALGMKLQKLKDEDAAKAVKGFNDLHNSLVDQITVIQNATREGQAYADAVAAIRDENDSRAEGVEKLSQAERDQIHELTKVVAGMKVYEKVMKDSLTPAEQLHADMALLTFAFTKGDLSIKEYVFAMGELKRALSDLTSPFQDTLAGLQEQGVYLQNVAARGREYAEVQRMIAQIRQNSDGEELTPDQAAALSSQYRMNEAMSTYVSIMEDAQTPQQQMQEKLDKLQFLLDKDKISMDAFTVAVDALKSSMSELADPFQEAINSLKEQGTYLQNAALHGREYAEVQRMIAEIKKENGGEDLSSEEADALASQYRMNEAMSDYLSIVDGMKTPQQAIQDQMANIKFLFDKGLISVQAYTAALDQLNLKLLELNETPVTEEEGFLGKIRQGVIDSMSSIEEITVNGINAIADAAGRATTMTLEAMGQMIADGKDRWKSVLAGMLDILKSVVNQMIQELIRLQIQQMIVGMMSGGVGSGVLLPGQSAMPGVTASNFGSQIPTGIPFKATGGTVAGGQPYIVGEEGPELFYPGMTGSIMPHGETIKALQSSMGGGKRETVVVQAQAPQVNVAPQIVLDSKDVVRRGLSDDMIVSAIDRNSNKVRGSLN